MSKQWAHGMFGCFEDCGTCIFAWFCPCYVHGQNAEKVGQSCVMCALSQFVPFLNLWARVSVRGKIREQKGIEGSCLGDLLWTWCCPICSVVQEAQELKGAPAQSIARE